MWVSVLGFCRGRSWVPYSSWCMSYLCVLSLGVTLEFAFTAMPMTTSCTPSLTYETWTAIQACVAKAGDVCVRRSGSGCSPTSLRSTVIRRSSWSSQLRTTRPPTECCSRLWALVGSECMQCSPSATSASSWTPPWTCLHGQIQSVKCAMSPSPAHHQQYQTLPGQGCLCQGRAVLGDVQGGLL